MLRRMSHGRFTKEKPSIDNESDGYEDESLQHGESAQNDNGYYEDDHERSNVNGGAEGEEGDYEDEGYEESEQFAHDSHNILERAYSDVFSEESDLDEAEAVIEFKKVLGQGVYLIQHSGDFNPQVLLAVHNNVVQYTGGVAMKSGGRRIGMRDIAFVGVGKRTEGFEESSKARRVNEDLCFSLVIPGNFPFTAADSLDLQASSALEREALVYGLSLLLEDSKTPFIAKRKQHQKDGAITHHMTSGHDEYPDDDENSWLNNFLCL